MGQVEPAEVEARAIANVIQRYADGTRRWRTPRATIVNVGLIGLMAALPALPGGQALTGVPARVSLVAFGLVALVAIGAAVAHAAAGLWSTPYKVLTTMESAGWCAANAALIGWSGSARSVYWMSLGALVVVTATTVHRHPVLLRALAASLVGLVGWFVAEGRTADAVLAAVLGAALVWFQRLSTATGWTAARERARAELLAERLRDQERARIGRELHDGVAAELTAALWQAQALEGDDATEIHGLVAALRATLAELRHVIRGAPAAPVSVQALARDCARAGQAIVDAHGGAAWRFDAELGRASSQLAPGVGEHLVRVVQEGVINALRHGHARHVEGTLTVGDDLLLVIEDDGVGCPHDRLGRGGTGHIVDRARALGGAAAWAPREGGGTRLTVRLDGSASARLPP